MSFYRNAHHFFSLNLYNNIFFVRQSIWKTQDSVKVWGKIDFSLIIFKFKICFSTSPINAPYVAVTYLSPCPSDFLLELFSGVFIVATEVNYRTGQCAGEYLPRLRSQIDCNWRDLWIFAKRNIKDYFLDIWRHMNIFYLKLSYCFKKYCSFKRWNSVEDLKGGISKFL